MQKNILVTGANKGIGFEIVRQLAEQGHKIILTARDEAKGTWALETLSNEKVIFRQLDVTDINSISDLAIYLSKSFDHLDVLINNAGIISSGNGFDSADINEVRRVMETNLFGPIILTKALLPLLKKSRDGRIINVSSGMGALNDMGSGYAGYRLSKTALNSFTVILANDLSGTKIKVNTMCPGWVRTDMGGQNAARTVDKGAETAVWLATDEKIPNGKFLRDKKVIDW